MRRGSRRGGLSQRSAEPLGASLSTGLDGDDPAALSRAWWRDVVVFSGAEAYRAAFSYAVANPPQARPVRLLCVLF